MALRLCAIVLAVSAAGCQKIGTVSQIYVNEQDQQKLELTMKQTIKGWIRGGHGAATGSFILSKGEKITSGNYRRDPRAYVLTLDGREWTLRIDRDGLRDESGGVWRLETLTHQLRGSL
jgi:hypothetical protein